jgi:preprotein translocase subunit SecE
MKKMPVAMSSTTQRGTRKRLRHIFLEVVVVEGIVVVVVVCLDSGVEWIEVVVAVAVR